MMLAGSGGGVGHVQRTANTGRAQKHSLLHGRQHNVHVNVSVNNESTTFSTEIRIMLMFEFKFNFKIIAQTDRQGDGHVR